MTSDTEKLDQETLTNQSIISLRKPTVTDGSAVHALIARCAPLDTNSMYCNLLQCFHFAGTAVVAEMNGQPRSEEHTSELQSRPHLVCRLLLEKKKKKKDTTPVRPSLSTITYFC